MKMSAVENVPLWDSVTHPFANALKFAFGCHHTKLSRVFTLEGHTYKVCCDCGATFRYSLETMSIVPHRHKLFAVLRRLRPRQRRRSLRRRTLLRQSLLDRSLPDRTSPNKAKTA
jgi:hypothetical protein